MGGDSGCGSDIDSATSSRLLLVQVRVRVVVWVVVLPADRGLRKPVQCGGDEEFIVDGRKPGFLWAPIRVAVCCCVVGCKMQNLLKTKLVFQDKAVYLLEPTNQRTRMGIEWEGGLRVLSAW